VSCTLFQLPDGSRGIVCTSEPAKRCRCGKRATLLCDWKVPARKSGTCDAPICTSCAASPAPDKHLCTAHAEQWRLWQARRAGA
jgi:hypothetical protein